MGLFRIFLCVLFMTDFALAAKRPGYPGAPSEFNNHLSFIPDNQQEHISFLGGAINVPYLPPSYRDFPGNSVERSGGAENLLDQNFYYLVSQWPVDLVVSAAEFYFESDVDQFRIRKLNLESERSRFFDEGINLVDLDISNEELNAFEPDKISYAPLTQKFFRLRALIKYWVRWQVSKLYDSAHYNEYAIDLISEAVFVLFAEQIIEDSKEFMGEWKKEVLNVHLPQELLATLGLYFYDLTQDQKSSYVEDRLSQKPFSEYKKSRTLLNRIRIRMSLRGRTKVSWFDSHYHFKKKIKEEFLNRNGPPSTDLFKENLLDDRALARDAGDFLSLIAYNEIYKDHLDHPYSDDPNNLIRVDFVCGVILD